MSYYTKILRLMLIAIILCCMQILALVIWYLIDAATYVAVFFNGNIMLNLKEAAQKLGLHKETVREKAKAGIIPAHKKCGLWYFFYEELVYWIKSGNNQAVQNDTANKEVSSWQNSLTLKNTKTSGITHSPRQMVSEYAELLGLTTKNKPKH